MRSYFFFVKWRRVVCLSGAMLFTFSIAISTASPTHSRGGHQLKISRIMLLKNGVGYFERRGKVPGGQSIELYFKKKQMNDLLKSLTVLNLGEGSTGTVVYDSTKTAGQLLGDFAFDLRQGKGMPQVLAQLQGAPVSLKAGSETISGTIVGVEKRAVRNDTVLASVFYLTLLDDSGRLRSVHTEEITSVEFMDEKLRGDMQQYLSILFQKHRRNEKRIVITPTGKGDQEILIGYVIETPVWKATYRVVIPEKRKDGGLFLQGWAIVDNVSGEDWKDVQLSLVSGLPVSFVQNLYDPLFRKRPEIDAEAAPVAAPVVHKTGRPERRMKRVQKAMAPPSLEMDRSAAAMGMKAEAEEAKSRPDVDMEKQMRELEAQTVTREMGELFEYRIDRPVTIGRNRSSLVPIVAVEVEGLAVDVYNEKSRPENPMSGIRLINTTGLTLEGGPLTVFQGGNYAGEALARTIKPGEQRYITYAVDLGLRVSTKHGSKRQRVDRVIINKGVIRMHRGILLTKTYTLDNQTDREKTIIIEHPRLTDRKLLNKDKPIETTENYLRFEVKVPGSAQKTFEVREIRDRWESVLVANLTPEDMLVYFRGAYFSKRSQAQLKNIMDLKTTIADLKRKVKQVGDERNMIFRDQKRLRDNLRGLRQTAEETKLRSRYIRKLTLQESRLEDLDSKQADLEKRFNAHQKQLNELIESLDQDLKID